MAPLTRCRATPGHVPGALIITEAAMVMEGNSAFWHEPCITSQAQIEGWRLTTEAVHRAGGRIVLQLWHGGRACHPLLNGGRLVVWQPVRGPGDEVPFMNSRCPP